MLGKLLGKPKRSIEEAANKGNAKVGEVVSYRAVDSDDGAPAIVSGTAEVTHAEWSAEYQAFEVRAWDKRVRKWVVAMSTRAQA